MAIRSINLTSREINQILEALSLLDLVKQSESQKLFKHTGDRGIVDKLFDEHDEIDELMNKFSIGSPEWLGGSRVMNSIHKTDQRLRDYEEQEHILY